MYIVDDNGVPRRPLCVQCGANEMPSGRPGYDGWCAHCADRAATLRAYVEHRAKMTPEELAREAAWLAEQANAEDDE